MAACATQGTVLEAQAQQLQGDLEKMMRHFGRQCRGIGKVFVTLVRQTERQVLEMGEQVLPLARAAAQPSSAASLGLSPSQPQAVFLLCICRWEIRVMPVTWSPWSTK
jgi:hypothetical protein